MPPAARELLPAFGLVDEIVVTKKNIKRWQKRAQSRLEIGDVAIVIQGELLRVRRYERGSK